MSGDKRRRRRRSEAAGRTVCEGKREAICVGPGDSPGPVISACTSVVAVHPPITSVVY